MKLDSKYFDSIRIQPRRGRAKSSAEAAAAATCQWKGCERKGTHRAPKGRDREGDYYHFCREHVSAYNRSYNYFTGMSDGEIADYQKDAVFGHRPTWTMGVNRQETGREEPAAADGPVADDPLELLKGMKRHGRVRKEVRPPKRIVHKAAQKHLAALHLDEHATADEIRAQFKSLVKLHHPDHNGGDRSSEERFREVITAYNYLKQSGLC